MSRVITFSRYFQKDHIRSGEPTFFIEKIWSFLADNLEGFKIPNYCTDWDWHEYYNAIPKLHTIRKGKRWKVGDKFSPRYWEGGAHDPEEDLAKNDGLSLEDFHEWLVMPCFRKEESFSGQIICFTNNISYP